MEASVQVAKWGNSLAVRLPKNVVETLGLKAGDEINIVASQDKSLTVVRDTRREDALARIRALNLPFPADYKFSRDEANER